MGLPFSSMPPRAAHLTQFGHGARAVVGQQAEGPARLDRIQLGPVPDEDYLGPRRPCRPHQLVQGEGPGQAGLVYDHELAGVQAPGVDGFPQ